MYRRRLFIFLDVLIFKPNDAPDATAQQPVVFGYIVRRDGYAANAEIGEIGFLPVDLYVQANSDTVDNRVASPLTERRQHLLGFIGAHEIFGEDSFDVGNAALDYLRIVGRTILPKQKFQHVYRHVSALFDSLGQVFADNLAVETLPRYRSVLKNGLNPRSSKWSNGLDGFLLNATCPI